MSQPLSRKSTASQSSSSGWLGHSPWAPKSAVVRTMPVPKNICQRRFTATRAVSGFSGIDDPLGEAEAIGRRAGGQRRQHGGRAGGQLCPWLRVVAAVRE